MSIYEYMKSAQAAALFDMPQASEAPRPEEAAPQGGRTGEKSTPAERNGAGDGVPVAAVAVAEESGQAQPEKAAFRPPWKLPRPNMGWVHAAAEKVRAGWFAFAFGITLAVIVLLAALGLAYWLGYRASVRENGTYDGGYAAAISENGTYESGYAAALEENGSYDEGYNRGYAEGKADGYEAGRSEGYEEGLKAGMATQSQAQAASGSETAAPQQTVWVSRYFGMRYHSTPDCSRVIDPVQISLEEAEQEGYSRCSRCYEDE